MASSLILIFQELTLNSRTGAKATGLFTLRHTRLDQLNRNNSYLQSPEVIDEDRKRFHF